MIDGNRGSGRTTLMLSQAYRTFMGGDPVIIVGANLRQTNLLREMFFNMFPNFKLIGGHISFLSKYELENKTQGCNSNTVVYWDHYAVEADRNEYKEEYFKLKTYIKTLQNRLNKIKDYINSIDLG